jgi:low temperature requirement protein LtrA
MNDVRRTHDEEQRASFTELFFDLVFVLVVTQLASMLVHDLTVPGAARTLFLLLAAWWAWIYTTWMTNWFDPEVRAVRAVLLVGMLASLVGALALPEAFGDRALLFVAGYVGIQTLRNAFVVLAAKPGDPLRRPLQRILGWTLAVAPLWLAGALADDGARVALWVAAIVLDYAGPFAGHWTPGLGRSSPREWHLEPGHFIERLEQFLLIALGESIVAAGATASGLDVTAGRLLALTLAFLMTVALWWLYFDFHAERTLERLKAAEDERGRIGRELSYVHIPLVAGIIVAAVANELVIAHPGEPLAGSELVALAAGPVLYLLGSVAFKARILHAQWRQRLVAAVLVAAAVLLGAGLPALALWACVVAIVGGVAALETSGLWRDVSRPDDAVRQA